MTGSVGLIKVSPIVQLSYRYCGLRHSILNTLLLSLAVVILTVLLAVVRYFYLMLRKQKVVKIHYKSSLKKYRIKEQSAIAKYKY